MMKHSHIHHAGFTLIEMLVYLAIFIVVSVAAVGFLLSLDDLIDQYRIETALYRSGTNAMEQILLSIRQGDRVDLINTIQHASSTGKITLENTSTSTTLTKSGSELLLEINSVEYGNVLNSNITVEDFTVYQYSLGDGEFVRVKLELSATQGSTTKSATFYGGASVRGAI